MVYFSIMEDVLRKIDQLKNEIDRLLPLSPENEARYRKKIRLEYNFNSNHIEGNTLTYRDTEALLFFDQSNGVSTVQEHEEIKAHDAAFATITQWAQEERPLSEVDIKNLNKIILVRPFWKEARTPEGQPTRRLIQIGDYKEQPNSVRLANGQVFAYASPAETPSLMTELVNWYRRAEQANELHPAVLAAQLHYRFVRIHPFDDGNGRVSRLLTNYVLLKHGLAPAIVKSADKKGYLNALNQADLGNVEAFEHYLAQVALAGLELLYKAAKGEALEEPGDLEKEIELFKRQVKSEVQRSNQVIADLYFKYGLRALLALFIQKHEPFNELFQNNSLKIILGETARASNLAELDHFMENLSAQYRFAQIICQITFGGYKFNEKAKDSIGSFLSVHFEVSDYELRFSNNKSLRKTYHENLDEENRQQMIDPLIKQVFDLIKKQQSLQKS
jgi:Fic family protein